MATLADLLTFHLPMGQTHQQLGITNPVAKFATDPFLLAGLLAGGLSAGSAARKLGHNKRVRKQLAAGFMPREAARKTALTGKDIQHYSHPQGYEVSDEVLSDEIIRGTWPKDPPTQKEAINLWTHLLASSGTGRTVPIPSQPHRKVKSLAGNLVEETGRPMRMLHGTEKAFERPTRASTDAVTSQDYGPGFYQTSRPDIADSYTYAFFNTNRGPARGAEVAPQTRMSYVDTRKPFDIMAQYSPDDMGELSPWLRANLQSRAETDSTRLVLQQQRLNDLIADYDYLEQLSKNPEALVAELAAPTHRDPRIHGYPNKLQDLLAYRPLMRWPYAPGHGRFDAQLDFLNTVQDKVKHEGADVATLLQDPEILDRIRHHGDLRELGRQMLHAKGEPRRMIVPEEELNFVPLDTPGKLSPYDLSPPDRSQTERGRELYQVLSSQVGEVDRLDPRWAGTRPGTEQGDRLIPWLDAASGTGPHTRGTLNAPHPALARLLADFQLPAHQFAIRRGNNPHLAAARHLLRKGGFDSVLQRDFTGSEYADFHPAITSIAFDPEQVYLPYIADQFRSQRPEAAGGLLSALLGGTGVARQTRR